MVPSQVQGTVDQYYHFLLGYLLPIDRWLVRHPGRPITVQPCGPMKPWFDLLPAGTDIEMIPATRMLTRYVGRRQRRVVLPPLDNPRTFRGRELRVFAERMRARSGYRPASSLGGIVMLERGAPDPYYDRLGAGATSGSERRSVPNLGAVADALASLGGVSVVDSARMTPAQEVEQFSNAGVLVAQHGGGLTNMIWMAPGSTVVEILPPVHRRSSVFGDLAAELGLAYRIVPQRAPHDPVDPDLVVATVTRAEAAPTRTRVDRTRLSIVRQAKLAQERLGRTAAVGWAVRDRGWR